VSHPSGPRDWSPDPAPWSTTSPAGWGDGAPHGEPGPPPHRRDLRRRRTPRSLRVLPWLVVLTIAAVYGSRWLPEIGLVTDLRSSLTDALPLPAPTDRDYPTPGYEEADARLLPAVVVPDAGGYAVQQTQPEPEGSTVPVTWSPCRPLHLVVDPTGAPEGFVDQVTAVAAEVSAATGLVLTVDGTTTEAASAVRPAYLPEQYGDRWAPVLVRFSDETIVPDLVGDVVGVAGTQTVHDRVAGTSFLVSGSVYLDGTLLTDPGLLEWYPEVLRHEMAHLVGLDHVDDPAQLMYPTTTVHGFQAGDLAGLALVGQGAWAPGVCGARARRCSPARTRRTCR
jgi:hypothetical protein